MITIFTDGSCTTTTKKGGWALIVTQNDLEIMRMGGNSVETTNNRMELQAVLEAIHLMKEKEIKEYVIFTDSAYIQNCFKDEWWRTWTSNGWKSKNRMPIKNQDLWKPIITAFLDKSITMEILKVKGHVTDNPTRTERWNSLVDAEAVKQKRRLG